MPPNGWRSTIAPVVGRLMYKLPARTCCCQCSLLAVVEALQAGGEAVAGRVHQVDRLVQVAGLHHRQQRAEELGAVRDAVRSDAPLHAGAHQIADCRRRASRGMTAHASPGFEFLQCRFQHAGGRADQRPDLRRQVPGRADREALDRVAKLLAEAAGRGRPRLPGSSSDVAEHFWPLWLNALCSTFLIAWSRSARPVTIVAFLPPVSASRFIVGLRASMRRRSRCRR